MSKTPPTLSGLIKEYQRNIKMREQILDKIKNLDEKRLEMSQQAQEQHKECDRLKRLIDWCIHSGESPVEAQLKHTADQVKDLLREKDKNPLFNTVYNSTVSTYNHLSNHTHTITVHDPHMGLASGTALASNMDAVGMASDDLVLDLNIANRTP